MEMRCHYSIFNPCNTRETIDSFARGPCYHLFKWYVFILLTKMRTETKLFHRLNIFSTSADHNILTYLRKSLIPAIKIK